MGKAKKFLVAGLVFVFGAILLITGWIEYRNSKRLAAEGKAVTAEVVGKDVERGRRGRRSYYLQVQFQTESDVATQRVRVSSSRFESARRGATVPVHYLPADPSICQVGEKVSTEWSGLFAGFGAWLLSAVLGFAREKDESAASETDGPAAKSDVALHADSTDDQQAA